MEVAVDLFAKKGLNGTSIREIASVAGVNLASINYHFKNKENLYWKVFDYNHDWIKTGIENLGQKDTDTAELAADVMNFFLSNGSAIMNTFKIILNGNIDFNRAELSKEKKENLGPPGQESVF